MCWRISRLNKSEIGRRPGLLSFLGKIYTMKKQFVELQKRALPQHEAACSVLKALIDKHIESMQDAFVQDLNHISTAAVYAGNLAVDEVVHLRDNLYRCDYSYDWHIAWTCSGTQEAGRVREKVRFNVDGDRLDFKFLKLEI